MKKKRIFSAVLVTVLTICVFCLCFYVSGNALRQLPSITQMNYNLKSDALPLTIADIEKLSERISFDGVSFCAELEETNIKEETVLPVLTNESYFEIYNHKLIGKGFTKENMENKDKVAVIESSLALKLFFNTNAVGKTITLNDEVYTICGIINEDENIINSLSSDGKQRVYVPYSSYKEYKNCEVNIIAYDNKSFSAPLIEQMNLTQYHPTNFSEKAKVIENFEHILLLILFIALCAVSLKIWYRLCRKFVADIKENLTENYFWKSLRAIPHKYILLIITVLGIPVVLLTIFLLSDFSIFIISKYIPNDNIFDVSYYISVIVDNSNNINSLALTGNTFLINLYSISFLLLVWLLVVFALFSVVLFSIVNILINRVILLLQNRG